jgi:hypothetical protein
MQQIFEREDMRWAAGKAAGAQKGEAGGGGEPDQAPWADRLMDALLGLLARPAAALPTAPLRDAVEAVFRAFAPHLTATGMWA